MGPITSFFRELRRRRILGVAVLYIIAAWAAIHVGAFFLRTGEEKRGKALLDEMLAWIVKARSEGTIDEQALEEEVFACAILGRRKEAVSALRQVIAGSHQVGFLLALENSLLSDSMYDDPEYRAIVAEVKAKTAGQLERVREWESGGEIPPYPESTALGTPGADHTL